LCGAQLATHVPTVNYKDISLSFAGLLEESTTTTKKRTTRLGFRRKV
jgi:hypothetical protein